MDEQRSPVSANEPEIIVFKIRAGLTLQCGSSPLILTAQDRIVALRCSPAKGPEYLEKLQTSADDGAPAKPNGYTNSLNGNELPIAMEVRRGRYLQSYEHPEPLTPNHPEKWDIPQRDHDHVFLKGRRIDPMTALWLE